MRIDNVSILTKIAAIVFVVVTRLVEILAASSYKLVTDQFAKLGKNYLHKEVQQAVNEIESAVESIESAARG